MNAVVAFSLKHRVLMVVLFVMMLVGGIIAFRELNIEAYPDPTPPMVDVITQSPGLSAEEIERYITIPIEVNVATAPHLTAMRTISLFGLSDVKLQFSFDFTYEQALQQVLNRLSQMPALPNGASFVPCFFGIGCVGAVVLPLNPKLKMQHAMPMAARTGFTISYNQDGAEGLTIARTCGIVS